MTEGAKVLRAWLIDVSADGALFLADICSMLQALAANAGKSLTFERPPATGERLAECRALITAELPDALVRELGVHRAQRVPAGSPSGRVETVLVGVEVVPALGTPTSGRPGLDVLKTYNYVLRTVIRHSSGEKLSLDEVLAGHHGRPIGR